MKYVIMADGYATRWNNYLGIPKHLVIINGERLIDRTVRLLKENGIEDIIIMASDDRYRIEGTQLIPQSVKEYEIERFDFQFLNQEVCFMYGDVFYSEEAVKTIIEEDKGNFTYFGRFTGSSIKEFGELFAIKVRDYERFKECCKYIKDGLKDGTFNRGIGWETYKYLKDEDVAMSFEYFHKWVKGKHEYFIQIDDKTDDIDCPEDYENFIERERCSVREELFEKFKNHYFPENEKEDGEYILFLSRYPIRWSSYPYFKRDIRNYLTNKYDRTHTVLDIGCGGATYYYLLREHYDIIDGIEGSLEVIEGANLNSLYRKVIHDDACNVKYDYYDIIIMGDCLEHIDYDKAYKLVETLCENCKELIIVIPYNLPMEGVEGKPYSAHKQDDLGPDNMSERYPMLELLWGNEYIGVYKKI